MHNWRAMPLKQRFYQIIYNKKNSIRKTIGFIDIKEQTEVKAQPIKLFDKKLYISRK